MSGRIGVGIEGLHGGSQGERREGESIGVMEFFCDGTICVLACIITLN